MKQAEQIRECYVPPHPMIFPNEAKSFVRVCNVALRYNGVLLIEMPVATLCSN